MTIEKIKMTAEDEEVRLEERLAILEATLAEIQKYATAAAMHQGQRRYILCGPLKYQSYRIDLSR